MKLKAIPFNVWDDYPNDDFGLKQETIGYVEEYDDMTNEEKQEALPIVLAHIQSQFPEIKASINGDDIFFEDMTHAQREILLKNLQNSNLRFRGIPFEFYSES